MLRKVVWTLVAALAGSGLFMIWLMVTQPQRSLTQCKANLKTIGLGLQAYHASNGHFPAARSASQPPHSWRVAMLPWMDHQASYDTYDFALPWDNPANQTLLKSRPAEFACPEVTSTTNTSYLAILGAQTAWPFEMPSRYMNFTDGTSNTAMLVDLHGRATEWTRPEDIDYADVMSQFRIDLKHVAGSGSRSTNMLFADGSVRTVSGEIDDSVLRMVLTPNGGRPLVGGPDAINQMVGESQNFGTAVDSSQLPGTRLWPTIDVEVRPDESLLYCPTLALAWQQYVKVLPQANFTELGRKLVDSAFTSKDISAKDLSIEVDASVPKVTCSLKKHLAFSAVFDSFHLPLSFHDTKGVHKVKSFGVTSHWTDWRFALAQVRVHDYTSPDNFVISITNLNYEDLILAKIPQPKTLSEGIEDVTNRIRDSRLSPAAREVVPEEDLVIPTLELSVFGDFKDQLNHPDQKAGTRVEEARQVLQFRLDERGAVIHSEAEVVGENGSYEYTPGTRTFIFDKPFLIMLREASTRPPYFAGWIGNTDLMMPRD
ncbi:MAG: DUF1559 domain-containing protein [Planctomycetaceae bacterium]|nr:DUF1559 domain-containing protein [Planctomycetaceae bacterium]